MKKILLLLFITIGTVSYSQIKVEDTKKEIIIGSVDYMKVPYIQLIDLGDYVAFRYRDMSFQHIYEYKNFSIRKSDLETLYGLLSDLKNKEIGTSKTVTLEDGGFLTIEYKKMAGMV